MRSREFHANLNRTQYAILGFLTQGPMSGYDIKKAVEGSVANFWSESFGQIYPILRRLTEEGLVSKRDETAGGRPRHVYTVTAAGSRELEAWLAETTQPPKLRIEVLLKLFFGANADMATNRGQVERYREQVSADLQRYAEIRKQLESSDVSAQNLPAPTDPQALHDVPYWLMTLRYGELAQTAALQWCDETLEGLRGMESADESDQVQSERNKGVRA